MLRTRHCSFRPEIAGILLGLLACSPVLAQNEWEDASSGRGLYVGVFGGGGASHIHSVAQIGTALYPGAAGGPLSVNATGSSSTNGVGLVGVQIGHEWSSAAPPGTWGLLPAVEFEAMYLPGTQRAILNNHTPRLPEHRFDVAFPMDNAALLTNVVLSFQIPLRRLFPYIGGGIGTTCASINDATSTQIAPPEPGINHFNSNPSSSVWSFSAQAKVGARVNLTDHIYVFTEYRYLYIGSANHEFGPTQYPTHVPTTPWTVRFGDISNHLAVGGIGFNF